MGITYRQYRRKQISVLVLTRKTGERIWIGDDVCVTVVKLAQGGVRLGIEAPPEMAVVREELRDQMQRSADRSRTPVIERRDRR